MFSDTSQETRRAQIGMLLWALLVGCSFPAVGLMSPELPPLLLTAIRFAIAAVAIFPLISEQERWPGWPGLALYVAMGLCLAGFFGTMFWAAHRTSALSMASLYVSVPLLAYCLGRFLSVEVHAARLLKILSLGAAGALALIWAEGAEGADKIRLGTGEIAFFSGCVLSALYPVLSKWGLNRGVISKDAGTRTFWSLFCGSVLIGVSGLAMEPPRLLAAMTFLDALVLVYLGVFSSAMTFWLQQRATNILTPGAVTAYSYLVPFVSMLLLFMHRPEQIGWQWLPGVVMVMFTVYLLHATPRPVAVATLR